MRVVHISKVTGVAGSERHLLMLLTGLMERSVEVSMLVLEDPALPPHKFYTALTERGIPFEIVPIHGHLDFSLVRRLTHHLQTLAPDVVHTHLIHGDLYGLHATQRADVPATVSSRHNDNPFRRNPVLKILNRLTMRKANRVIAISTALGEFVTGTERIPTNKVAVIRYGMEAQSLASDAALQARARLGLPLEEPVIGFFGRLIAQKGVDVLLEAFVHLRQKQPNVHLVVVGDGDLREALTAQATTLGLDENITFAGWIDDAPTLMPGCDVIVMPSRWEGFGLVALEAMNAQRPLVVSRVSALPEIVVDGETGYLVHPDNPGQLAEALDKLLADPALADAMGQAGYARLTTAFGVDRMVEETLSLYQGIVSSHQEAVSQS